MDTKTYKNMNASLIFQTKTPAVLIEISSENCEQLNGFAIERE